MDFIASAKESAAKHSAKKYGKARLLGQISLLGNIANTVVFQTSNKASFIEGKYCCSERTYNTIDALFGIDGTSMEEGH